MQTELIICDDDPLQAQSLASLAHRHDPDLAIVCFTTPGQVLAHVQSRPHPRIYLMDIMLENGESGIDAARQLRGEDPEGIIIFLSGYLEKACDVYDVDHCWFVYKPQKEKRLPAALDKAREILEHRKKPVLVHEGSRLRQLDPAQILCLERIRRYTLVTCPDQVLKVRETFARLQEQLPATFVRCHRSYMVNLDRIRLCAADCVELDNGVRVPVSRSFQPQIRQAWARHLDRERLL